MKQSLKLQDAIVKAVEKKSATPRTQRIRAITFQMSVIIIMIAAFAVLTFLVITIPTFTIDLKVSLALQSITNPVFSWFMNAVSWVGFGPQSFITALIIVVIIYKLKYRWESVLAVITASTAALLNQLFKIVVHRVRPSADILNVTNLLKSYSFPSGHVMFYTAFFGFLCFLIYVSLKPSWIRTALLILFGSQIMLIGISRVYLGEHWASDAVGAYLLGGLCLIGAIRLYRWGKKRFFIKQPVAKPIEQEKT